MAELKLFISKTDQPSRAPHGIKIRPSSSAAA